MKQFNGMGRPRNPESINSQARTLAALAGCSWHTALQWLQKGDVLDRLTVYQTNQKLRPHGRKAVTK